MSTRILVVDDSPSCRITLEWVLAHNGYHVEMAEDGMDAICAFATYEPEVILLDIAMPRIDGWQLLEFVRKNRNLAHVPVIMISGRMNEAVRARALAEGANDCTSKPIQDSALISMIEKHLAVAH